MKSTPSLIFYETQLHPHEEGFITVTGDGAYSAQKLKGSLNEMLETVERGLILKALKESGGVQTRASERLGISERVLRYKLKKYNIKEQ